MDIEGAGWAVLSPRRADFFRLRVAYFETLDRFARKCAENLEGRIARGLGVGRPRARGERPRMPQVGEQMPRSTWLLAAASPARTPIRCTG